MDTKQKIKVMRAFEKGEVIQKQPKSGQTNWEIDKSPNWNWEIFNYRILRLGLKTIHFAVVEKDGKFATSPPFEDKKTLENELISLTSFGFKKIKDYELNVMREI